jgi:hypothetical protein
VRPGAWKRTARRGRRRAGRSAYETYLATADDFLHYAVDRVTTCKPGTDTPLREDRPCAVPLMTTYQGARHDVQDDGIDAIAIIARALPPTVGTVSRVPEEAMPDEAEFDRGSLAMREAIRCETVPVMPSDCRPERG